MEIRLPGDVKKIIETIEEAGFEAYAVGGCVRDCLLGKEPNDWDVTTSATPEQVKSLFRRTIDTGIKHGTVTVMINRTGYEITTYRIDGEYEDARHPREVIFTGNLSEDLRRRDFTINAMAYSDKDGLVDLFGGQQDLEDGIIRCVGDARERFSEDALRMLRAVRFSAQLGFEVEEHTLEAIKELAPNLQKVSEERIQTELVKTLLSPNPGKLKTAYACNLTKVFLPEFDRCMECKQNNPNHIYSVGEHILKSVEYAPDDRVLRLTMLFHDIGKPECKSTGEDGYDHFYNHAAKSGEMAEEILRRLKFDNHTTGFVKRLCACHDSRIEPGKKYMRRALNRLGEDLFPLYFEVQKADVLAQSDLNREGKLAWIAKNEADYKEIMESKECFCMKDLAVSGKDLLDAGVKPGKEIGEILNRMLELVLEDPENNEKSRLLELCLPKRP